MLCWWCGCFWGNYKPSCYLTTWYNKNYGNREKENRKWSFLPKQKKKKQQINNIHFIFLVFVNFLVFVFDFTFWFIFILLFSHFHISVVLFIVLIFYFNDFVLEKQLIQQEWTNEWTQVNNRKHGKQEIVEQINFSLISTSHFWSCVRTFCSRFGIMNFISVLIVQLLSAEWHIKKWIWVVGQLPEIFKL